MASSIRHGDSASSSLFFDDIEPEQHTHTHYRGGGPDPLVVVPWTEDRFLSHDGAIVVLALHDRIRRCLFGRPNRNEVDKWLSEADKKQLKTSKEKWSYDFELDTPVSGDVEYEILPLDKVPSVYKPCKIRNKKARKVLEFDSNVPSVSKEEEESESDWSSDLHRPLTRSFMKQHGGDLARSLRNLKQAKLTNYLRVRKRRTVETQSPKRTASSLKSTKSVLPSSPFRFVDDVDSQGVVSPDSTSPRSSSTSPMKSPRKRPAQNIVKEQRQLRVPKQRSHTAIVDL
ncbi:hypothetical protein KIN20_036577 [Parelaphostrongylus tenuis]|uniref:Cyclin-dependent kinase inhibitor domain-containing protein n=1 Tax=Parelaphostrongylus tenuis TaxID=148309 RepID=A0AAD5RCW2_PARTN|nr:hypothetical protein KIN20_036577 [Parelaphostrongylus tenuis]